MEIYVDDMLVKSLHLEDHFTYLSKMFNVLQKYEMKLNPNKCAFRVSTGKFLRFMVNQREIEANSDKIYAIFEIKAPLSMKEVQRLTERIIALNCFMSKATHICLPFFMVLKKVSKLCQIFECKEVLVWLKEYLSQPLLLSKPRSGEDLYLYLVVSDVAVSMILIREMEGTQLPLYYISHLMVLIKTRYSKLKKLALALLVALRKLKPYFQVHPIIIFTNYPLRQVLHYLETSGSLMRWSMELSLYEIRQLP